MTMRVMREGVAHTRKTGGSRPHGNSFGLKELDYSATGILRVRAPQEGGAEQDEKLRSRVPTPFCGVGGFEARLIKRSEVEVQVPTPFCGVGGFEGESVLADAGENQVPTPFCGVGGFEEMGSSPSHTSFVPTPFCGVGGFEDIQTLAATLTPTFQRRFVALVGLKES